MRALGRSFLTADGLVNIYGYAPAADFSSFEPEFGNIVSSFRISPEHRFQPERDAKQPLVEKTTSWKQLGWVVGLMALAGIGWIVLSRWRNSVYSDEL